VSTDAAASESAAWSRPNIVLTISVATVTFIVQTSGSHWPVASQNAATSPSGSTMGEREQA